MHASAHLPLRCCIIGATGFIGGQIARAAIDNGWRVRGVRRRPDALGAVDDLPIEWVSGDLGDPASLVSAMRDCPLVFHAAGYYPRRSGRVWQAVRDAVQGMRHVLAAAAETNVKRLIYTSSLSTVGQPTEPGCLANESDLYVPGTAPNTYFEAKWAMEAEAMRAAEQGVPVVTVIPTATFGPGDVKPATGTLLLMAAKGLVPGYPPGVINVVDVRDVAVGHIAAADHGRTGQRYILGGHNLAIAEILTVMARAAGRKPPCLRLPLRSVTALGAVASALGITGSSLLRAADRLQPLDDSWSRSELRLGPPIAFEQTCLDALDWFRAYGYLKTKVRVSPGHPNGEPPTSD